MTAQAKGTLLVVDDEAEIREIVEMHVAPLGLRVIEAADGLQAVEVVKQHHVDVIVSDLMMPRMTGLGLLSALREAGFMKPFIFLTAYPSQDSTLQALRLGAFDYLEKPFEGDELRTLLGEALRVSLETQALGGSMVACEIQKLRTLRYGGEPAATAHAPQATTTDAGKRRLEDLFIAEATPQLLFCEAAIKGLEQPDERAFELGYLFRVMQGIASAAESIGAGDVANVARAAEHLYTALRVRPRAVGREAIQVAQRTNGVLQQLVSTVGTDAETPEEMADVVTDLQRLTGELEGTALRAS